MRHAATLLFTCARWRAQALSAPFIRCQARRVIAVARHHRYAIAAARATRAAPRMLTIDNVDYAVMRAFAVVMRERTLMRGVTIMRDAAICADEALLCCLCLLLYASALLMPRVTRVDTACFFFFSFAFDAAAAIDRHHFSPSLYYFAAAACSRHAEMISPPLPPTY